MSDQSVPQSVGVQYNFHGASSSLQVTVLVLPNPGSYPASDGNNYQGYRVVGGTFTYTPNGGQEITNKVDPQVGADSQYLWVSANLGNGGSSYGIDATGLEVAGKLGNIAWISGSNKMAFNFVLNGVGSIDVTLASSTWPPKG